MKKNDPIAKLGAAKALAADRVDTMDSQDVDDDGTPDVHHYPLPPALLAAADKILGAEEVDRLLGGPAPRRK